MFIANQSLGNQNAKLASGDMGSAGRSKRFFAASTHAKELQFVDVLESMIDSG